MVREARGGAGRSRGGGGRPGLGVRAECGAGSDAVSDGRVSPGREVPPGSAAAPVGAVAGARLRPARASVCAAGGGNPARRPRLCPQWGGPVLPAQELLQERSVRAGRCRRRVLLQSAGIASIRPWARSIRVNRPGASQRRIALIPRGRTSWPLIR